MQSVFIAEADGAAFTACVGVADVVNFGQHQTLVFDRALTNKGNHYHTTTGVFTAPYNGVYIFQLSAMTLPGKEMYLDIIRDGNYIDDFLIDGRGDTSYESASEMWILKLNAGSEVWIRNGFHSNEELHGNYHTMF